MQRHVPPGHHRSLDAFRAHLAAIDPALGADELPAHGGRLGEPLQVGPFAIGNRFAMHPMEGWDGTPEGAPTELTVRRWRRFGESGAKLIWGGEAFAVQHDGRANPRQLYLNPGVDVRPGLASLLAALRDGHRAASGSLDGLVVGLQLTHSGRWARPEGAPQPRAAQRNPVLDRRVGAHDDGAVITDGELEALVPNYVRAASLAREVGFDFVDIKVCHGYLLHELLGARARPGPYGGSFDNRTRLFRTIVDEVRRACPDLGIGVRVSIADVHPFRPAADSRIGEPDRDDPHARYDLGFGVDAADPVRFDFEEPRRFLALCRTLGIELVNVTLGSPYTCPHLQRPAAYPPSDGYLPPEDPLRQVACHLRAVRACKAAEPALTFVGTGYTYLQEWLPHVAHHEVAGGHVDLVGLGRMALVYPDLVRDVLNGVTPDHRRLCRTLSDCTTAPRNGIVSGCYPLDPFYRAMPEAAELRDVKRALASRPEPHG